MNSTPHPENSSIASDSPREFSNRSCSPAIESVSIDLPDARRLVSATAVSPAFVPVVSTPPVSVQARAPSAAAMQLELHVRLANGVELEMGRAIASIEELTTLVQILGRMPCSGSTKG